MKEYSFKDYYKSSTNVYPIYNILDLENPDLFECEITSYQKSHSILTIHCSPTNLEISTLGFKLQFSLVSYMDLFPKWNRLDVEIATPDECVEILSQSKYDVDTIPEDIFNQHTLYIINSKKRRLKVVAASLVAYHLYNKDDYLNSLNV